MPIASRISSALAVVAVFATGTPRSSVLAQSALLSDDFEAGLARWRVFGEHGAAVVASGDASHGRVLALTPNGDVHVLVRGSERWNNVRMEGDVQFPERGDSYLGFVYAFTQRDARSDFGLIYLKGDGNYLQANPHHDYGVTRTFYPEFVVRLGGASRVETGRWQHFRLEVVGGSAHVYVGDMTTPAMTFGLGAPASGAIGLQPRSVGGPVWVDNVVVTPIDRFSYAGPPIPDTAYQRDSLVTSWRVAGPFARTRDELARHPNESSARWRAAVVDVRGAVSTAATVDYHGERTVAYYRANVAAAAAGTATLHVSSVEDLALWVNGRFAWFIPKTDAAWFDVGTNPAHAGRRIPVDLQAGDNTIVVRVRGGSYPGGGFYARMER